MPRSTKLTLALLALVFVFTAISLRAQPSQLDSLFQVWQDDTKPDSVRLAAFDTYLRKGFMRSQPDSAMKLADQMMDYAKTINNLSYQARGEYLKGNCQYLAGKYFNALKHYATSEKLYETISDGQALADIHNNCGLVYKQLGNYPKALGFYQLSLAYKEKHADSHGIVTTLGNIGVIYSRQMNYDKALEYFQKALDLMNPTDKLRQAIIYGNMGNVYLDLEKHEVSLNYFKHSAHIFDSLDYKGGLANALNNIGNAYGKKQEFDKAHQYYLKSLSIKETIGDEHGVSSTYSNIGRNFYDQQQYVQAIKNCLKAYDMAVKIKGLAVKKKGCKCLYESYKAVGNTGQALLFYEVLQEIEDSLDHEETAMELQKMEFQKLMLEDSLANIEKARIIEEQHQQEVRREQQSKNWSLAGGVLFLILAGGFYSRWLYVRKSHDLISKERDRSDRLLHNILPEEVAAELKLNGKSEAKDFEDVTVLFTDFVAFTQTAEKLSAKELVEEINTCFRTFDEIINSYNIEKIKTIGDAYMAAGGLHDPKTSEPKDVVKAALEMQAFIEARHKKLKALGRPAFQMRVGIHTGPVVAGIVGVKKFQYDIWGDTVNTAARMESHGSVGKVNISEATYNLLKDNTDLDFEERGKIDVKGKGAMTVYYVSKA